MPAAGGAPVVADFLTANDDYGRSLFLRLDGFTQDGSQILGILSETWKRTATFLFEYEISNGNVQLVDLTHEFARITTAGCSHTFAVLGTFETGASIIELQFRKAVSLRRPLDARLLQSQAAAVPAWGFVSRALRIQNWRAIRNAPAQVVLESFVHETRASSARGQNPISVPGVPLAFASGMKFPGAEHYPRPAKYYLEHRFARCSYASAVQRMNPRGS